MATAKIIQGQGQKVKQIYPIDYSIVKIKQPVKEVQINSILPFRVKFSAIQIESLFGNPPAIPLQVIGYSNYIL
jgi:hypothetical protein